MIVCGFALSVFSLQAIGAESNVVSGSSPELTPSLSWEEFRESCENPGKFHNQAPPSNITIQCSDNYTEFLNGQPGQIPLPVGRKITTSVFSNKYHVRESTQPVVAESKMGSCFQFKEVEKKIKIEQSLSCDDVIGMKFTLTDYCVSVLNAAKESKSRLIESRETGREMNTCTGKGMTYSLQ
jgi:hypothetical protein